MKHLSLVKIIAALCICNVYLFTCGVIGAVGDNGTLTAENVTDNGNEAMGQGTQDFLMPDNNLADQASPDKDNSNVNFELTEKIEMINFGQPSLTKTPVSADFVPSKLTEKLPSSESLSSGFVEDDVIVDTYEPPVSTIPPSLLDPPESDPQQSSSSSYDPEPPDTSDFGGSSDIPQTSEPASSSSTDTSNTSDNSGSSETHEPATSDISGTSEPASSSTSSSESSSSSETPDVPVQPDEVITNTAAANEIISVSVNGDIVSGTALDIISGIVANEVGGSFAPEAIKAQAVASYTYIKYFNLRGSSPSAYLGEASDSIKVLVASVIGEAVYYNDEIIQATYSASSAGCTASSENVWGTALPYLQSVYCELDAQYDTNYGRTKKFKSDDIKSRVYSTTGIALTGDPSNWFAIDSRTEGKYVGKMSIGGYHTYIDSSGDTVSITGRVFRERIMGFDVRSSAFDISYDANSDEFTVTTYGYGHGVGMSQNGANALATHLGYTYKQILEFYYTGTTVR